MTEYNPPLTKSTLQYATYGVPFSVTEQYVADRIDAAIETVLRRRQKVSYMSLKAYAEELREGVVS